MATSSLILLFLFWYISSTEGLKYYMIGGTGATIEDYPYQISLRNIKTNVHVCGGAIITRKIILTAAHCIGTLRHEIQKYYVFVGSSFLSGNGDTYEIDTGISHETYNDTIKNSDIGLIIIKYSFTFREGVQPIKILMQDLPVGTLLTITGWGLLSWPPLNSSLSDELQMGQMPIVSEEECKKTYEDMVGPSHICILEKTKHVATCRGDSGGPAVYKEMLVGIISFGYPCGTGVPDVATKVYDYISWITENIKNYCEKNSCTFDEMYPIFRKGL